MDNSLRPFLKEGMEQYKSVSAITVLFQDQIHVILEDILKKNREWGKFKPKITKIKKTIYWMRFPYLHVWLPGEINNKSVTIDIGISWYQAEGSYPFYFIKFADKSSNYNSELKKICGEDNAYSYAENGIRFNPDPKKFNIEGDFEKIIFKFVKAIS